MSQLSTNDNENEKIQNNIPHWWIPWAKDINKWSNDGIVAFNNDIILMILKIVLISLDTDMGNMSYSIKIWIGDILKNVVVSLIMDIVMDTH